MMKKNGKKCVLMLILVFFYGWRTFLESDPMVSQFLSADSRGLNMFKIFDKGSRPTIRELVV